MSDPVHYGVVYVYVYANDVAQLLYYNIQRLNPYDNNKCNNNSPQYVILDRTVRIQDDDTVNYVVNDIFRSNNNDMNPNNNDNAMINANCYYDDTNNTLSFYLLWQHVQVRALNDDHNDVIVDHHTSDDDYGIHVIHDTARNNNDFVFTDDDDHNNVLVNNHASDSDHDIHVNNNIHIKNNDDVIDDNITYNNSFKSSTCIDNNDVGDTDCDCYNDHNYHIHK